MNVLVIGDIVGPEAVNYVVHRLPDLRRSLALDLVVANAENAAITGPTPWDGFGMTVEIVARLLESGVDVVTSGNHAWDGPEAEAVHRHPRVLRPHNVPDELPGNGLMAIDIGAETVTVVNLCDRVAEPRALPVYAAWLAAERRGTVVVDFHGDSAWEKMIFATAVDGEAAAVIGTHTHQRTNDLVILPGGTAFVADAGMTGPGGSLTGFSLDHFAARYQRDSWSDLPPFQLAPGPIELGAVWVRIDAGRAVEINRVT